MAICLALAAMTFAVFGQTLHYGFLDYDDSEYVYENPMVIHGLTLKGLAWAFTSARASNWHPLTWLSLMADGQLYGLHHPGGFHVSNVLIHTATVIALFLVLRNLTGALWRSAFVAAVFAIHPLRVESVAWVAERKDVLSGLFFVLTVGAYVRYARRSWSLARHGLVLLMFALGLMSKPMLVTVPVVLLLLDYWPLRREETAGWLVLEKLPMFGLAVACCAATVWAQRKGIQSTEAFSIPLRLANGLASCMIYLGQMIWPAGLAAFYPFPRDGVPLWELILAALLLAAITGVAIWQRRQRPWLLVGWFWYLVMLLPVSGIIKVGLQGHADRFTYLPQIGIYLALAWLVAQWRVDRVALGCLMAGVVIVLMACAWTQAGYWSDDETLWTHALACATNNAVAHFNLGNAFQRQGRRDEAIAQLQQAVEINPNYAEAHDNLGNALRLKGNLDEAIFHYKRSLQIYPDNAKACNNLGYVLMQKGRFSDAILCFQQALRINPDDATAKANLQQARQKERLPGGR